MWGLCTRGGAVEGNLYIIPPGIQGDFSAKRFEDIVLAVQVRFRMATIPWVNV